MAFNLADNMFWSILSWCEGNLYTSPWLHQHLQATLPSSRPVYMYHHTLILPTHSPHLKKILYLVVVSDIQQQFCLIVSPLEVAFKLLGLLSTAAQHFACM